MEDEYNELEEEAYRLGSLYENFWKDFHKWDTSGYIDSGYENNKYATENYYFNMADIVEKYQDVEMKSQRKNPHKQNVCKATTCKFYLKGTCKFADNCRNLHIPSKTTPCKFYLKGTCKFPDNCRYLHLPF